MSFCINALHRNTSIRSFLRSFVIINSNTVDFLFFSIALTILRSVLPQFYLNHLQLDKSLNFHVTQVYDDETKWTNTVITAKEILFMNYVGIDIAKQTHYASIMNSNEEILAEPFPFLPKAFTSVSSPLFKPQPCEGLTLVKQKLIRLIHVSSSKPYL